MKEKPFVALISSRRRKDPVAVRVLGLDATDGWLKCTNVLFQVTTRKLNELLWFKNRRVTLTFPVLELEISGRISNVSVGLVRNYVWLTFRPDDRR